MVADGLRGMSIMNIPNWTQIGLKSIFTAASIINFELRYELFTGNVDWIWKDSIDSMFATP